MPISAEVEAAKQRVRAAQDAIRAAEVESGRAFVALLQTLLRCGVIGGCGNMSPLAPFGGVPCGGETTSAQMVHFSLCSECEQKLQEIENELQIGARFNPITHTTTGVSI